MGMNAASLSDITGWLDRLYEDPNLTHMIMVCDTYDWSDYPVYVSKNEDVYEKVEEFKGKNMQQVMEVYSRNHTKEEQLGERRAFHYD